MTDKTSSNGHDTRGEKPDCNDNRDHWLVRPATIRRLWWIFGAILAATVVAQLFVHVHGHFTVDEWLGFDALYGFLTCVGMVVFAKLLGFLIKRSDDYYEREPRISARIDDGPGDSRHDSRDNGHHNRDRTERNEGGNPDA